MEKEAGRTRDMGIWMLIYGREGYPQNLAQVIDPPIILYGRGHLLPGDSLAIAVVGTRKPTSYGRKVTGRIIGPLAGAGVTIVSGLARGIDSFSHRAALDAGGRTIAVVGTGLDTVYPPENKKLCRQVEEQGAVLSEYPPGEGPLGWHFPARNRIIAGLSLGVMVVEAPPKSGALITVKFATDYNRAVYAVPGQITSINSQGCNRLISDGAKPVTCPDDILEELHLELPHTECEIEVVHLDDGEKRILQIIGENNMEAERIICESMMPAPKVNGLLLNLELKGLIRRSPGNIYCTR